ncbi:MAG: peptidase M64 [Bacteroidales bacterium]|nr:peptidase M64 [Bacteroidales bacterium]
MKRFIFIIALCLPAILLNAGERTLRIDYIFSGNADKTFIAVDEMRSLEGWAGRRHHMDSLPLAGNGRLTLRSAADSTILYRLSFSTLFQEWQHTEEATRTNRSFENVFLMPMPEGPAFATVELFDSHGRTSAHFTHPVNPSDIMLRPASSAPAVKDIHIGGTVEDCIDVAIVAEGYTAAEQALFLKDASATVDAIFSHEPFCSMRRRFNFRAVCLESKESGVSEPAKGIWKDTPLHSNFSTFYSDRYLTTLRIKDLHDALAGVPYEHIIILANTDSYGGGGIYNSYTLTTAHHKKFRPVVVHEFGHSFAGLADEYFYDDQFSEYYHLDFEPWEPNITTMRDFGSKWEDMLGKDGVSVLEGGGYQSKGVWRACEDCRMRTNEARGFCPVCRRSIERLIRFYTED